MVLSIYLHKDRVDILKTFGDLNNVINRILDACDEGYIELENKPECEPRDGASRYNVIITNENYIELLGFYGVKNKNISLRRLIYWFVDNEMYNELDWEPINDYIDSDTVKINKLVQNTISNIDKLKLYVKDDGTLTHAKDLILTYKR